jgi:hypothetical protein
MLLGLLKCYVVGFVFAVDCRLMLTLILRLLATYLYAFLLSLGLHHIPNYRMLVVNLIE